MSGSMHIYSIPECPTDDETSDNDNSEPNDTKLVKLSASETNIYSAGSNFKLNILEPNETSKKECNSEREIKRQLSPTAINISEFSCDTDSESLEDDNAFANSELFDTNAQRIPQPYRKNEDCHSSGKETYEKLLLNPLKTVTHSSAEFTDENLIDTFTAENGTENCGDLSSGKNNTIPINTNKYSERRRSAADLAMPAPQAPRGRSGSVQWIQNILQNIDERCRSLLDLRRPSDIAEEGIRKSNEGLEMDHSDEESSELGPGPEIGGRRYSENVIGKQKRFPFATGIGHFRGLWRDRNNKRQEPKEIDNVRTDVCPLFNFPRNYDEDELILDALRQAMRKCTIVDPSVRPTSSAVFEQLSQLMK